MGNKKQKIALILTAMLEQADSLLMDDLSPRSQQKVQDIKKLIHNSLVEMWEFDEDTSSLQWTRWFLPILNTFNTLTRLAPPDAIEQLNDLIQ